jgi:hypothetical protein
MGAIAKAAYESNGDSQQRQICCVVIAIKGLAKRVWQKWVGVNFRSRFLSVFLYSNPLDKQKNIDSKNRRAHGDI